MRVLAKLTRPVVAIWFGSWRPKDEKAKQGVYLQRLHLGGYVGTNKTDALQQANIALRGDLIKLVKANIDWPTSAAFDTRILGIEEIPELNLPLAGFDMDIEVHYEASDTSP
jgi:hypothetical protein